MPMTDDLDALESDLWHSDAASALTNRAARAINALRAQLAEAQAVSDTMARGQVEQAVALAAANARADLAEAERAAQIEADAGIAQKMRENWMCAAGFEGFATGAKNIMDAIRAQPHDRTALDRMLAETEARGYQLAADEAKRSGWHLRRHDLAKRDAELAKP